VKLPNTAHLERPWRIHELTRDFRLEDVWALPTPGGPNDFSRLVHGFASGDLLRRPSRVVRVLFAIRRQAGKLLRWDQPSRGAGAAASTLRGRLPADLRDGETGPQAGAFTSLYLLEHEWAAELANKTVHGVIHLGWVQDGADGYRGELAVYAKPNGLTGRAYMAAIRPFRHLIVYPRLLQQIEEGWRSSP
jgi:Protein of unknown function (DUF2867)